MTAWRRLLLVTLVAPLAVASGACAQGTSDAGITPAPDGSIDSNSSESAIGTETSVGDDSSVDDTGSVAPIFDAGGDSDDLDAVGDVDDETGSDDATDPTDATFTCSDVTYDVDGLTSDGCEVEDPLDIHTKETAHDFGSVTECDDADGGVTLSSTFPSDDRTHEPSGRNGALGLPVFFKMEHEEKTFCDDDPTYNVTFTGGSGSYQVRFFTAAGTEDSKCSPVTVNGNASTGSVLCSDQADGDEVYLEIEKLSGPSENPSYTVQYHN